jgi:hypothetical protein
MGCDCISQYARSSRGIESKLQVERKIQRGPVQEYIGIFRAECMSYRIAVGVVLQSKVHCYWAGGNLIMERRSLLTGGAR